MHRELASAYLASAAKIASWAAVSAMVYRLEGPVAFAVLVFVRATIGLLNYVSVGLGPAMIRMLAEANAPVALVGAQPDGQPLVLAYESPRHRTFSVEGIYANGLAWAFCTSMLGFVFVGAYAIWFSDGHALGLVQPFGASFAFLFGVGLIFRLSSEPYSAVLQTSNRIALDNLLLVFAEAVWIGGTAVLLATLRDWALAVGIAYIVASMTLLLARVAAGNSCVPMRDVRLWRMIRISILARMFSLGLYVTLAQLADFLYAPTDYILITYLLQPWQVATYAPAVQIDSALLLLVSGLAAVLLPKSALAHVSGNTSLVRAYYVRGTLLSGLALAIAAAAVWILSPWIFRLWLGDAMLPTQGILPLVLIHTVIGGSSAAGRSILLGMGKVRPFTASVLIAGAVNVLLSFIFVRFTGLGLYGIILGTIIAVTGRCALWTPWYILRQLRPAAQR